MSIGMEPIEPPLLRAGFWRRSFAFFIDCAIMMIPLSILAGLLFSATDGRLYMASPFISYSYCGPAAPHSPILKPAPPENSNFESLCKVYSVTGMTANLLTVGRRTVDGNLTSTVSYTYPLNRKNEVIDGSAIDLTWLADIFVLLLVIPMQARLGRTFGQMAMSSRLALLANPASTKIPLRNLLLRYFYIFIIPIISLIPLLGWFFLPFTAAVVVSVFLVIVPNAYWGIGNLGLIVQRRDPWFDRWSGLAEVKVASARAINRPPPLPAMPPPLPHP